MTKQITKTTVKLSITNDRLAIKVSYVSGEVLKLSSNRGSARIATERPVSFVGEKPATSHLRTILNASYKFTNGENNGQLFERLAKFFETTNSIVDAATKIA